MKQLVASLVVVLLANLAVGGTALAQPKPEFTLGFKALADQIPSVVGEPLEGEHWGANGDSVQRTSRGLMVWRKADNWTAFTNGSRTWISGPSGAQERSNEDRFAWETASPLPAAVSIAESPEMPVADPVQIALPVPRPTPSPATSLWDAEAELAAVDMINQSRRQYGVPPLVMDEALRQTARAHALDMSTRRYFDHVNPEGKSPLDRMKAAGISYTRAAENLGDGHGCADSTASVRVNHQEMMAEFPPADVHRRNILDPDLRKVGIGVYKGTDGNIYYVSDFTS